MSEPSAAAVRATVERGYVDSIFRRASDMEVRDRLRTIAAGDHVGDRDNAMLALSIFSLTDEIRAARRPREAVPPDREREA